MLESLQEVYLVSSELLSIIKDKIAEKIYITFRQY